MSAITRRHGPAPNAFVIPPPVSAFFVDIVDVGAITPFPLSPLSPLFRGPMDAPSVRCSR